MYETLSFCSVVFSIHLCDMSSSPSHSATKIPTNSSAAGPQSQGNNDDDKEMNKYIMEPQDRPLIIRTSRAFRHFKNPPQPHMCIKDHTIDGHEIFINVMSWTRIVMPQNSDDPIPLYGGMKVCLAVLNEIWIWGLQKRIWFFFCFICAGSTRQSTLSAFSLCCHG